MTIDLILTPQEEARVRRQLEAHAWYRSLHDRVKARVDELMVRDPEIPVEKGRVFFDACPRDNAPLLFDPYKPLAQVCSKCGRNWSDAPYRGAWVRKFLGWLQKRLVEAGILYRLSGKEGYAAYVAGSLQHFVRHYRDYPLANNLLGPGRLFQSIFLEAFWLVDTVAAYDLTRASTAYSQPDHEAIEALLRESCSLVRGFDEGRSNRQAFYNVGMGAVGLLYGDEELIGHVLDGPHGFSFHMRESLLEDGLWYEGETYHFATLDHLLGLAEMARHRGVDLYEGSSGYGALRPMFDGPLKVMYPDLTFPSRKDAWFGRSAFYHKEIYELGYARYREARYGRLLTDAYRQDGGREELGWRAFLYLEPELPGGPVEAVRPQRSEPMPGTGLAVLRRERGEVAASLEYGHYGGGHGHPDRLHLNLYSDGVLWFLDPGTGWYDVPELAWYRSTLAHNTVVVDGQSQDRREGKLTAFGDTGDLQLAQALVEELYPGVTVRRTLCLGDSYLLDVLEATSDEEHSYDWALHSRAELQLHEAPSSLGSAQGLGEEHGYEFLQEVTHLGARAVDATLTANGAQLRVLQLGSPELYRARSLGIPLLEEVPFTTLVARRTGKRATFATCYLRNPTHRAQFESIDGGYALSLGDEVHALHLDEGKGAVHTVTRHGALQKLAVFGRSAAMLPSAEFASHQTLPQASFTLQGEAWNVALPPDFGHVRLQVYSMPPGATLRSLPEGASAEVREGGFTVTQAPAVGVWLEQGTRLTLHAGCDTPFRFHVASYGRDRAIPELRLPDGWSLVRLDCVRKGHPSTWEAVVRPPGRPSKTGGELGVAVASHLHELPLEVVAPLGTRWRVASLDGRPHAVLELQELRGLPCTVTGTVRCAWPSGPTLPFTLALAPHGAGELQVALPLAPVPPAEDREEATADVWELPGLTDSAGAYRLRVNVALEAFRGRSEARLPLAWCLPHGTAETVRLRLDDAAQVYWAERPWGGTDDLSADAELGWDGEGLHVACEVRDDVHVTDASEDDLFENDSVQLYFDFRPPRQRSAHFAPGVAAYLLAPTADKEAVRLQAISGARELSNRQARASWFSADGVRASCEPTPSGYRLRVFFPYASLGMQPVKAGDVIGFDLSVSDNDGTWYRNLQVVWSGARGRRCYLRGSYHDPREWGWLIVGEGERDAKGRHDRGVQFLAAARSWL